MKSKQMKLVVLIVMSVIAFIVLTDWKKMKAYEVSATTYDNKVEFKGIYFCNETILYQGNVKDIKLNYEIGSKVKKDSYISDNLTAKETGLLIDFVDGYENKFSLENIKDVNADDIEKIINKGERKEGLKIINNNDFYLYLNLGNYPIDKFNIYNLYKLTIDGKNYSCYMDTKFKINGNNYLIVKLIDDFNIKDLKRGFEGYLVHGTYTGLLLPKNILVKYDNTDGVFVKYNGYARFKKVKIIFSDEEYVVVEPLGTGKSELKHGDMVIIDGSNLKPGDKVR